jgi:hypothetical protein
MAVSIEGKYTGLRARLVIENETISGHCDRVAALRAEFPHTIRCIGQPVDGTCVTYAFGLLDGTPRLVAELEGLGVKAGGAFVQWLMDEEHLVEIETARTNGLALYFDQGSWKHVGIMNDGDRVTSKWVRMASSITASPRYRAITGTRFDFLSCPVPWWPPVCFFDSLAASWL